MPRIRKKDGLPFYEGEERTQKLNELANEAILHHQEATAAWRGALDHALKAGQALNEAKRINGGRSKWTKWLVQNFCRVTGASKETARVYMRIARKWNDPRLTEARNQGLTLKSIQAVLKVLRGDKNKSATKEDVIRDDLRKQFAEKLRTLDADELKILGEAFEVYTWPKWYKVLKNLVCIVLEEDHYGESEAIKAEVRTRGRKRKEASPQYSF